MLEQRISDAVAAPRAGPGNRQDIVGVGHDRGSYVSGETFNIVNDIAFEINAPAFGGPGICQNDDSASGINTANVALVNNGVVEVCIEIALFRIAGLIAIEHDVSNHGDLRSLGANTAVL